MSSQFLKTPVESKSVPYLENKGKIIESDIGKAKVLNNHLVSQSNLYDRKTDLSDLEQPSHSLLEGIYITPVDVTSIIRLLKPNKTTGSNLIGPNFIKEAMKELAVPFLKAL